MLTAFACTKTAVNLDKESLLSYFPLAIGNAITYKLDSTRYVQLGSGKEVHSYIIKDTVEKIITETSSSKTYRIGRLMRNEFDTTIWNRMATYYLTIDSAKLELMESNKKYIQLVSPVKDGLSWNRNVYNADTLKAAYSNTSKSVNINNLIIPASTTLLLKNDTILDPKNKQQYSAIYHWKEIYGKNIGLIFLEKTEEIWQPPNVNSKTGYYDETSYHIKISFLKDNFRR